MFTAAQVLSAATKEREVHFPNNVFLLLHFLNAMAYIVQAVFSGVGWDQK